MKFRPDLEAVIDRYRQLYQSREPGSILIHVFVPPAGTIPYDLRDYQFPDPAENARYLRAYIDNRICFLNGRLGVMDDYVPDIYIHHGIAAQSAYIAGKPIIGEDTSWAEPVILDWKDLESLTVSSENVWFRLLCQTAEIFAEELGGQVGLPTFYHYSPLDMANALRGNQLFFDFSDSPEQVRRLLDFCTHAIIYLEEQLWPICGDLLEGAPLWGSWVPGHALMMSEDIADLCRTEYYSTWAAPWTQQVIDRYDGALIHNHSKGLHLQKMIGGLKGLQILQVSEDPNQPRPFDHLEQLLRDAGDAALQIYCRPE
ncbi:MAG: hypothetical protein H0S82_04245 [Anaerolineaceae bacterium]|nr:hypothetical protein [Anaerolineaceae bacterium]